jgi:hypothetical protein
MKTELMPDLVPKTHTSLGLGIEIENFEAYAFITPAVALVGKIAALEAFFIRQCFDLLGQNEIQRSERGEGILHFFRSHGCGHRLLLSISGFFGVG